MNVIGRGAGQAVLQLKVQYGIDWEELNDRPKRRFFDLHVDETYSHFRNKSHVTIEACVRYETNPQLFRFNSVYFVCSTLDGWHWTLGRQVVQQH